ncbi:MAG: hypothetical protein ABJB76_03815 [Candidatus Nitrosocosmicus sp.]
MDSVNDIQDAEISFIFEDARNEIDQVKVQAKDQKKKIIIKTAKRLEGKIPTATISMEIVIQLRGKVSERFIRECLDEKYKQKSRVDNAKKQQKHHQQRQKELKLAVVTPLNPEIQKEEKVEDDENKQVIILEANGRTAFCKNEDEPSSTTNTDAHTIIDRIFDQPSHQSYQDLKSKKHIDRNHEPAECHSCQELYDENLQLKEALEKSSLLITADKMVTVSPVSTYNNEVDTASDILPFEFFMFYKELQKHMAPLYQKMGERAKIWFNGKINTKTGVVIYSTLGRVIQQ